MRVTLSTAYENGYFQESIRPFFHPARRPGHRSHVFQEPIVVLAAVASPQGYARHGASGTRRHCQINALRCHHNSYYDAVIACIRDAESILIFGPGEAKGELKKRLERNKLGEFIVDIETIDKMTNRQIAAKVRQYFQDKSGRQ